MNYRFFVMCILMLGMGRSFSWCPSVDMNPWFLQGAIGGATYSNIMHHDGQNALGRFGIGYNLIHDLWFDVDLELGIQNGNTMRIPFSKSDIDILGGVPISVELKPVVDILANLRIPLGDSPLFGIIKGGGAYRQLQIDRESIPNISQFSPEAQGGIGYRLNDKASLTLTYQYIFGQNPTLQVDTEKETGVLRGIPSQQALMLGLTVWF